MFVTSNALQSSLFLDYIFKKFQKTLPCNPKNQKNNNKIIFFKIKRRQFSLQP